MISERRPTCGFEQADKWSSEHRRQMSYDISSLQEGVLGSWDQIKGCI